MNKKEKKVRFNSEAEMKKLVVSHVRLINREDGVAIAAASGQLKKLSKSTIKSFTRVFFEAQDQEAMEQLLATDRRTDRIYRPLMSAALEAAGINPEEKFAWNELAGNQKGNLRPGFIMREHKKHELYVTFAVEGTESSKPLIEEPVEIDTLDWSAIVPPEEDEVITGDVTVHEEIITAS